MLLAAGLGFLANLYRAGLLGLERQVTLNAIGTLFGALRSLGAVAVLVLVSPTPVAFCLFQAFVAAGELAADFLAFYRGLPRAQPEDLVGTEDRRTFRRFAGGLAITDTIWVGVLQLDRVVLSALISLKQLGYFSVSTTAAASVSLLVSPIQQALQPRFSLLAAQGDRSGLEALYFRVTHGVSALVASAASVLCLFPVTLVLAWTGNPNAAAAAHIVLPLYAAANALVAITSLPFLLQFALGDIRLHVIGHVAIAAAYIPAVLLLGRAFGSVGTGMAWLGMNLSYFAVFVPMIHRHLLPGEHGRWLLRSVLRPAVTAIAISAVCALLLPPMGRFASALAILGAFLLAAATSFLTSESYRTEARGRARDILVAARDLYRRSSGRNAVLRLAARRRHDAFVQGGRRFVLFLVPSGNPVNGGIMSIFSIAAETARLGLAARVAVCTPFCEPRTRRYTKFDNAFDVLALGDILARVPVGAEILLHVPEVYAGRFVAADLARYRARPDVRWRINILLQNIDLIPPPETVNALQTLGPVTATVAHKAYAGEDTARRLGCPVHFLSTWICPEAFQRTAYADKEKLVAYSPDRHERKVEILRTLATALPDHRFIEIRSMTYRRYRQVIGRAKFMFTFGEGLDGYFIETIFSGGVAMAIYNERFFTEKYRDLPGVFADAETALTGLPEFLHGADSHARYPDICAAQFEACAADYVQAEYLDNLRQFYATYFSQTASEELS
jgi:O-antigen/teichoic acid export membrane protein